MNKVTCIWEAPALLGEGPLWLARENAVYWVDIFNKQVHRLALSNGVRHTWTFDVAVTSLMAREAGGFVGSVEDGFAFIDLTTATIEPITLPEANLPGNRFNDGKVDSNGRFWAGSMDKAAIVASGSLYRLDPDLSLYKMDSNYIVSNGPTFSVDGQTLYHTDSIRRIVFAFDLHTDGSLANKRPFIELTDPAAGAPDGITVDSENCLWLSHFGGARLTRYSSEGKALQVVPLPVPNITSCTFGGPRLDTLYITTARIGLSDEALHRYPLSGSLFAYEPGVTGLPTPFFVG